MNLVREIGNSYMNSSAKVDALNMIKKRSNYLKALRRNIQLHEIRDMSNRRGPSPEEYNRNAERKLRTPENFWEIIQLLNPDLSEKLWERANSLHSSLGKNITLSIASIRLLHSDGTRRGLSFAITNNEFFVTPNYSAHNDVNVLWDRKKNLAVQIDDVRSFSYSSHNGTPKVTVSDERQNVRIGSINVTIMGNTNNYDIRFIQDLMKKSNLTNTVTLSSLYFDVDGAPDEDMASKFVYDTYLSAKSDTKKNPNATKHNKNLDVNPKKQSSKKFKLRHPITIRKSRLFYIPRPSPDSGKKFCVKLSIAKKLTKSSASGLTVHYRDVTYRISRKKLYMRYRNHSVLLIQNRKSSIFFNVFDYILDNAISDNDENYMYTSLTGIIARILEGRDTSHVRIISKNNLTNLKNDATVEIKRSKRSSKLLYVNNIRLPIAELERSILICLSPTTPDDLNNIIKSIRDLPTRYRALMDTGITVRFPSGNGIMYPITTDGKRLYWTDKKVGKITIPKAIINSSSEIWIKNVLNIVPENKQLLATLSILHGESVITKRSRELMKRAMKICNATITHKNNAIWIKVPSSHSSQVYYVNEETGDVKDENWEHICIVDSGHLSGAGYDRIATRIFALRNDNLMQSNIYTLRRNR